MKRVLRRREQESEGMFNTLINSIIKLYYSDMKNAPKWMEDDLENLKRKVQLRSKEQGFLHFTT